MEAGIAVGYARLVYDELSGDTCAECAECAMWSSVDKK